LNGRLALTRAVTFANQLHHHEALRLDNWRVAMLRNPITVLETAHQRREGDRCSRSPHAGAAGVLDTQVGE